MTAEHPAGVGMLLSNISAGPARQKGMKPLTALAKAFQPDSPMLKLKESGHAFKKAFAATCARLKAANKKALGKRKRAEEESDESSESSASELEQSEGEGAPAAAAAAVAAPAATGADRRRQARRERIAEAANVEEVPELLSSGEEEVLEASIEVEETHRKRAAGVARALGSRTGPHTVRRQKQTAMTEEEKQARLKISRNRVLQKQLAATEEQTEEIEEIARAAAGGSSVYGRPLAKKSSLSKAREAVERDREALNAKIEARKIRHATTEVFLCPISNMHDPPGYMQKRIQNEEFCTLLEERVMKCLYDFGAPFICTIDSLESPDEFDVRDIDTYEYTVYGGMNSRAVFARLIQLYKADQAKLSPQLQVRLSNLMKRSTWLYCGKGLTPVEAHVLGEQHNADLGFRHHMSIMERIREFRALYKANPDLAIGELKSLCYAAANIDITVPNALSGVDPQIQTAMWDDECFDLLLQYNKLVEMDAIPSKKSAKTKKKRKVVAAATSGEPVLRSIKSTITQMNGARPQFLKRLLLMLCNGTITITEACSKAIAEKKGQRCLAALLQQTNCDTEVQAHNRFGADKVQHVVSRYATFFNKKVATDKLPAPFVAQCQSLLHYEKRQRDKGSAAAAAGASAAAAAGTSPALRRSATTASAAAATELHLEFPVTFPSSYLDDNDFAEDDPEDVEVQTAAVETEFQLQMSEEGLQAVDQEEAREARDRKLAALTFRRHIKQQFMHCPPVQLAMFAGDVLQPDLCVIEKKDYKLIVVDPPYGKHLAEWDESAWGPKQLEHLLQYIDACQSANSYVLVIFTPAEVFSHTLQFFRDSAARSTQYCCWNKVGQGDAGRQGGQLIESFELFIAATFVRSAAYAGVTKELCHPPPRTDDTMARSNVFSCSSVRNKWKTVDQEILNPCQKPLALMKYIVETWSSPADNVLDLCGGSGSTSVAAITCRRSATYVDILPEMVQGAQQRLEKLHVTMVSLFGESTDGTIKLPADL